MANDNDNSGDSPPDDDKKLQELMSEIASILDSPSPMNSDLASKISAAITVFWTLASDTYFGAISSQLALDVYRRVADRIRAQQYKEAELERRLLKKVESTIVDTFNNGQGGRGEAGGTTEEVLATPPLLIPPTPSVSSHDNQELGVGQPAFHPDDISLLRGSVGLRIVEPPNEEAPGHPSPVSRTSVRVDQPLPGEVSVTGDQDTNLELVVSFVDESALPPEPQPPQDLVPNDLAAPSVPEVVVQPFQDQGDASSIDVPTGYARQRSGHSSAPALIAVSPSTSSPPTSAQDILLEQLDPSQIPERRRNRRRHLIIDKNIKINDDRMRAQMQAVRPSKPVFTDYGYKDRMSVEALFANPGMTNRLSCSSVRQTKKNILSDKLFKRHLKVDARPTSDVPEDVRRFAFGPLLNALPEIPARQRTGQAAATPNAGVAPVESSDAHEDVSTFGVQPLINALPEIPEPQPAEQTASAAITEPHPTEQPDPAAITEPQPTGQTTPAAIRESQRIGQPDPAAIPEPQPTEQTIPAAIPESQPTGQPDPAAILDAQPTGQTAPAAIPKSQPTGQADSAAILDAQPTEQPDPAAFPYAQQTEQPDPAAIPDAQPTGQPDPAAILDAQPTGQTAPAAIPKSQPTGQADSAAILDAQPTEQPDPAAFPYAQQTEQPDPAAIPDAQQTEQPDPAAIPGVLPTEQAAPAACPEPQPTSQAPVIAPAIADKSHAAPEDETNDMIDATFLGVPAILCQQPLPMPDAGQQTDMTGDAAGPAPQPTEVQMNLNARASDANIPGATSAAEPMNPAIIIQEASIAADPSGEIGQGPRNGEAASARNAGFSENAVPAQNNSNVQRSKNLFIPGPPSGPPGGGGDPFRKLPAPRPILCNAEAVLGMLTELWATSDDANSVTMEDLLRPNDTRSDLAALACTLTRLNGQWKVRLCPESGRIFLRQFPAHLLLQLDR